MTLYRLTQDVYQNNCCQGDEASLEDALANFLSAANAEELSIFLVLTCILNALFDKCHSSSRHPPIFMKVNW